MNDYATFSRARLKALLKEHGLDKPLDSNDLTLEMLDIELRLDGLDRRLAAAESEITRLQMEAVGVVRFDDLLL